MKKLHTISPEELEQIERFLQNGMTEAEANTFRQSLETDAALREKTEEVRLLLLGVQEAALKEKLDRFHKDIRPSSMRQTAPVFSLKKWLVAASVLVVVAAAAWWFLATQPVSKKIYAKYYSPDPGLATVMSSTSNYDFEKAMVEYKNGEYTKAVVTWDSLLKRKPGNDTITYFLGAARQAMGKEEEAINQLEQVIADSNSVFYHDACWYLGLIYLKNGDKTRAAELIEKSQYPQAAELLQAIHK